MKENRYCFYCGHNIKSINSEEDSGGDTHTLLKCEDKNCLKSFVIRSGPTVNDWIKETNT